MRRVASLLVLCALLGTLAPASRAGDGATLSPYQITTRGDGGAILAAAAASAIPRLFQKSLVVGLCPCAGEDVNSFDRPAIGHSNSGASRASSLLVAGAVLGGFALDALDANAHGGLAEGGFKQDAVVMLEAVMADEAINQVVKVAVNRPRPYMYNKTAAQIDVASPENYSSFYSGHTSVAFAAAISYARTYALRHPESGSRTIVYAGAVALGSAVGALRVISGKHFPSDVLAAAAAGTAVGLAVPQMHLKGSAATASLTPLVGGAMVTLQLGLH